MMGLTGKVFRGRAQEEAPQRRPAAQSIRMSLTWNRFGDAIERAVVREPTEAGGRRVVLPDHEIFLTTADVYCRGESPPVDALFAMLEEGFRMAGADPAGGPNARMSVGLVTDQDDGLAGLAFFAEE